MSKTTQLLKGLGYLQDLSSEFSLQQLRTLLLVVEHPGISATEVAESLEIATSSASRNADILGTEGRLGRPGLKLIERRESPSDRRIREFYLTSKGERILARVLNPS